MLEAIAALAALCACGPSTFKSTLTNAVPHAIVGGTDFTSCPNGTDLIATTTSADPGTWNFGGPFVAFGGLQIGYTPHWKWADGVRHDTFREYKLKAPIVKPMRGQEIVFEIGLRQWDLSKSWHARQGGKHTHKLSGGKGIQLSLCDLSGVCDIRVRLQTYVTEHVGAQLTAGSIKDLEVQRSDCLQLTQNEPVSVHVTLDLAASKWRASYGACGTGFDIKVGGHTSMTEVSSIKLGTMAPDSWGNKEIGEGAAGDFVKIQHLLLTTATAAVESAGSKHGGHRRHAGNKS